MSVILGSSFANAYCPFRVRRIKCDEAKPACLRCTSTGRSCDGYSAPKGPPADSRNEKQLVHVATSPVTHYLNSTFFESDQEYRAFDYFRSQTAPELALAMKSNFWQSLVLQLSHYDPAIRHAVVAFGFLSERLHINGVLTSDNKEANQRHAFACLYYYRAIKELRKRLDGEAEKSVEFTLISCFLFICFEFLQGNDVGVLAHLRSGLKIFRSAQHELKLEKVGHISLSSELGEFKTNTRQLYQLLDWLASLWLGKRSFEPPNTDEQEPYVPIPSYFSSVVEAEESLFRWMDQVYQLQHKWGFLDRSELRPVDLQTARAKQEFCIGESNRWQLNVESLLVFFRDKFEQEDLHRITVLRINHKVMTMIMGSVLEYDEARYYRALDPSFKQIVSLSSTVLLPVNVMTNCRVFPTTNQIFSFGQGVIQPLYFAAIKCGNLRICQKAISLLGTPPWREGAWESASMAKIAKKKVSELEKEGFYTSNAVEPTVVHDGTKEISSTAAFYPYETFKVDNLRDNRTRLVSNGTEPSSSAPTTRSMAPRIQYRFLPSLKSSPDAYINDGLL